MKKIIASLLWSAALCAALTTAAFAQELMVGGQVVGVRISTKGVLVAGLSEIETADGKSAPAKAAGICQGDLIVKIEGREVESAAKLIEAVGRMQGESAELTVRRGEKTLRICVTPALSAEGQWLMGMWLRDSISGIGTVTFYDPQTKTFGALGHGVSDEEGCELLPISDGSISQAEIVGITKGASGAPGELNGCADVGRTLGVVDENTQFGIFGQAFEQLGNRVMTIGTLCTGRASILSTIDGQQPREYAVEINRLYSDGGVQHAMLTVTDGQLRAQTGGIVQGMSGSPIIQNGKLVGAVTHVFVSDPTRGYGISIQDMLKAAGIEDKAA